jgi:hypothetical protein
LKKSATISCLMFVWPHAVSLLLQACRIFRS